MITKTCKGVFLFCTVILLACQDNGGAPAAGSGDCYNRVTNGCNEKYPDKNYGDKDYRDCIDNGLDWCDKNEPLTRTIKPVFDSMSRIKSF